jgi:AcrR family transcriptional regulator
MVEAILDAAARVFVRHGYPRATTNRIAEAAGVSVGSLYQYFPSKDAIAVELLRRYRETLLGLVHRHLAQVEETTLASVARALIGAVLRAEGIDPSLHRVLIEQVLRTGARAEIVGFEEKMERLLADAIRDRASPLYVAPGAALPRNAEIMAFVLVRAVLGAVHSAVVDRPGMNGPALVDELTRLVVRFLEPSA